MSGSIYVSELEIDKRLYVAGFDLHDAPDHRRGHQDLQNQRRMDHDPLRDGVDGVVYASMPLVHGGNIIDAQ